MKKIEVFTQFHHFNDLCYKLNCMEGVSGVTVLQAHGFGRGKPSYDERLLKQKSKLEIFCKDEIVENIISAILEMIDAVQQFKGKIYVLPVDDAIRISTGERGEDAV